MISRGKGAVLTNRKNMGAILKVAKYKLKAFFAVC